jgi:predicted DNA-binding transcriptional regulator YafY
MKSIHRSKRAAKTSKSKKDRGSERTWRVNEVQVQFIHTQLLENKFPTSESLALRLNISKKTVKRIIRHMKDERDLPIKYSRKPGKVGYYYAEPVSQQPGLMITEQELMTHIIAHRAMQQFPVKEHQQRMGLRLDKISQLVDQRTLNLINELDGAVYFRPFAPEKIDVDLLSGLAGAIRGRYESTFDYRKFMAEKDESKTVCPWFLTCAANSWYLVAYDVVAKEPRTYMLSRMKKLEITGATFIKPKDYTIEKHFEGAFIVLKGKESHDVVIEFDAWAAAYIRNREFTPDQKIEELPNGGLRISMHLTALEEVEAWVCYWRDHAYVVSPGPLRERLYAYGQYLVKAYAPGTGSTFQV